MALVSLVVPVYHNAASLPELLARFQQLARQNAADRFEFVFVDDGSRDHSFAVLHDLARAEPRMRVIKLSRNFGSNAALLAGLDQSRGDVVAAIAADLQDPPELIHEMLLRWREGRKVVLAARACRDDGFSTGLVANTFYALFRRFALASMPRGGFDFFLIDRQVCNLIRGMAESNSYLMGLILWLGFDPAVLPYHRRRRAPAYGRSMWTLAKKLKHFVDAFVAFSRAPVQAASLLGTGLTAAGVLVPLTILFARWCFGVTVPEWTPLLAVLLVVAGVQLVMTGMLGEYLWRNLEETRRRPRFVVEQILDGPEPGRILGGSQVLAQTLHDPAGSDLKTQSAWVTAARIPEDADGIQWFAPARDSLSPAGTGSAA